MSARVDRAGHHGLTGLTIRMALLAAVLGTVLGLLPLGMGMARADDITHIRVNRIGASETIPMAVNKSILVDLPTDAAEVIVSQPGVANAILRSKRRAVVQSTGSGDTNIFFLDAAGRTIVVLDVSVKGATSTVAAALRETYQRVLPGAKIDVESVQLINSEGDVVNRVVLSGTAVTADDVTKALTIATQFAGSPDNVASVITVGGPQQVTLQVTVAEVQREAVKQFGINLSGSLTAGGLTTGLVSTQALGGSSNVITNNGIGAKYTAGGFTLQATLNALERHGALRTLASPTLTALSGAEAEFLAGGQYPVPTQVDDSGHVTYTFKDFGVKLKFTPTIKSDGSITLAVDTSVSEPTTEGGFTVGGVTIPGTKERQAKTSVELGAGQTLSIGGLMQDTVRTQINRLPGLGDIPILGTLFRSRDFIHSQTELVVLVTPTYASAGKMPELPTDRISLANDAEAVFLGHIENVYGVGDGAGKMRGGYDGSVGFLLD